MTLIIRASRLMRRLQYLRNSTVSASFDATELKVRYQESGYASPFTVMSESRAEALADQVEGYARDEGKARYLRNDAHLLFKFVDELVRRPEILDPVEALLGPDVMLLRAAFFIKSPNSPGHVTWHQDLTYWGLDKDEEVTAWIAFNPATEANGCMRFIPGSHRHGIVEHKDTDDDTNLLSRAQVIKVEVDEEHAVLAELGAGQFSLHHGQIYHASGPNRTDGWRIGLAARYVTPRMKQVVGSVDHATLLRGEDRYGHFEEPPRPARDLDPDGMAFFRQVVESKKEFLYQRRNSA